MAENIKEINENEFEQEVSLAKGNVILDFYSTECPPCDSLATKYEEMASYFDSDVTFLKMFRQGNKELSGKLDVSSSPTLIFYQDGQEVGNRLSGTIRKADLESEISDLIGKDSFNKLRGERNISTREYDLAIIGAGPAGLSAALYAAQAKQKVVVIDQQLSGGQVNITHSIANYPGTGKEVAGHMLAYNMLLQVTEAGADMLTAMDVTKVTFEEGNHQVLLDNEVLVKSKAIVLAMGADPRKMGIPGEAELMGKGVSYCATCDGKYYEGKELIVIGGGNSAVEESLFLTKFASKITMVHQFDEFTANKTAIEKAHASEKIGVEWSHEPRKFEKLENGKMQVTIEDLKTKEVKTIQADGIFVFVGYSPNTESIPDGLNTNDWDYILTDEDMATNIKGVYAVGDIRNKKYRQVVTAVSDGCIAALASEKYIESLDD